MGVIEMPDKANNGAPTQVMVDCGTASVVMRCPCGSPIALVLPLLTTATVGGTPCGRCQTVFSIDQMSYDSTRAQKWAFKIRGDVPRIVTAPPGMSVS